MRQRKPLIVVPETANARSDVARVVRHRRFDAIKTERVDGFRVTSIPETVVLLARELDDAAFESTFDSLLLSRKLLLSELELVLAREADSRLSGLSLVRDLVADRSPHAPMVDGSYLEGLLESLLRRAGVSGWTREFPFSIRGRPARVDFFFPTCLLVVEADGRSWHMRSQDFESDRQRDNELAERGIQVVRFTYRMLDQRPEQCIATICRAIEARSHSVRI